MEYVDVDLELTKWKGTIKVPTFFTFLQLIQWEKAVKTLDGENINLSAMYENVLPVLCEFIVEWNVEKLPNKVTPEDFPGDAALLTRITDIISKVFDSTQTI